MGYKEKLYCIECKDYRPREEFKWYNTKSRSKRCIDCQNVVSNMSNFDLWYSQNKDKKYIQNFLENLRKVTGIYSPEDLIKKHRRF